MGKKKEKILLPPDLPPDISEDEIELSEEDELFVKDNKDYASFVSNLDTKSITRHVTRVADVKDDALESIYEERLKRKAKEKEKDAENGIEVDRVDALPVKTLDGKLFYRTVEKSSKKPVNEDKDNDENEANGNKGLMKLTKPEKKAKIKKDLEKSSKKPVNEDKDNDENEANGNKGLMKLTKPEKKAKIKKERKEAKKAAKEAPKGEEEEMEQTPQAAALAEVEKELRVEETNETKKYKLAELGTGLLTDPESNITYLKEMLQISKDGDHTIQVLGLKSLLAVFKDIIPGYRIRLPTEKEMEMSVSKPVKKMRFYEYTLLTIYKAYLQRLILLEQKAPYQRVAVRCICSLLDAVPHFNFRENLLVAVIENISSPDEVVRKLCCDSIKSLFTNEGKHGGEATVAAVQLIAEKVKAYNCQLHPDSIEVFMSLSFDEGIGRMNLSRPDKKLKSKKGKYRKHLKEEIKLAQSDRKKNKKELMSKTRDEVDADFKGASFAQDDTERKMKQSEVLSGVFQTYFRILRHTMLSISPKSDGTAGASWDHPLLSPCLNGIGRFAHLIDMDFMADLISCLRKLAGEGKLNGSTESTAKLLTVSERLRCCIVTFKVMRNNLDALNVDLQDFFVQLYSIILEYRPERDQGEVLAEALKIMLCDDRQHDMQRAAAFIKRLASFALCFGSAESMAALATVRHLLQKNVKCRNLLENDAGGGSISGQIAKYQPYASDPNLSGALASVLWELNILTKHYHPAVSTIASSISTMTAAQNSQVYHSILSPQLAFKESALENELFKPKIDIGKSNQKRKRGDSKIDGGDAENKILLDEDVVAKKLSEHFGVIHDINETTNLSREMQRTAIQFQLYDQFKKQKKANGSVKEKKTKRKEKSNKA